jgi:hypothetical protein
MSSAEILCGNHVQARTEHHQIFWLNLSLWEIKGQDNTEIIRQIFPKRCLGKAEAKRMLFNVEKREINSW